MKHCIFNKYTIDIISWEFCESDILQTQIMRVQKNPEALRQNKGKVDKTWVLFAWLDSQIVRNFECLKLLQYNSIINIIASYTFVFAIG